MTHANSLRLTGQQLATPAGTALLELLRQITHDGEIDLAEALNLRGALADSTFGADVPAVAYLRDLLDGVLDDGAIDSLEMNRLYRVIRHVLPTEESGEALGRQATRDAAEIAARLARERLANPATKQQRAFIAQLEGHCPVECSRDEAAVLIEEFLNTRAPKPSRRQRVLLRFWDQERF